MSATITDVVARSDANLPAASRTLALACATGDAWQADGASVSSSGNGLRAFNAAYITRCDVEVLRQVCDYLGSRVARYRVRIREDVPVDDSVIDAAGLERQGGIPSLVLASLPAEHVTGALEVRRVGDPATLREHVEVVAAGFGWQPDLPAQVFTERLMAGPAWHGYTGYLDGRPVAACQLFVHERVAGIYYVATVEAYRRRGFGEAITRHAVVEGALAGCDMAALQASPMGLPVYARMGFRQVSYYRQYVPKEA